MGVLEQAARGRELRLTDGRHRDRHVDLQFRAALRGHDDLLDIACGVWSVLRKGNAAFHEANTQKENS